MAPDRSMKEGRIGGGSHLELMRPVTGKKGGSDNIALTLLSSSGSKIGVRRSASKFASTSSGIFVGTACCFKYDDVETRV